MIASRQPSRPRSSGIAANAHAPLDATAKVVPWLAGHIGNAYSQFGEDGLVRAVFDRIGTANKWCFEVGAADGQRFSNTRLLIESGWNAVLIENDEADFAALQAEYKNEPAVQTLHRTIFPWTFDDILDECDCPADLDFGVIDIDEQDFWVWAGLQRHRPRVVLIEYAVTYSCWQLPALRMLPYKARPALQAGSGRIFALGCAKGYVPLAQTVSNILFCRKDCLT